MRRATLILKSEKALIKVYIFLIILRLRSLKVQARLAGRGG